MFVWMRAARYIQRRFRWIWKWRKHRNGAATKIQRYSKKWLIRLRLKYYINAVVIQTMIGRGCMSRIRFVAYRTQMLQQEQQRYTREDLCITSSCLVAKTIIKKYINGPCGIPSLSIPFWLCMGRKKRNGRRFYKQTRRTIKKQIQRHSMYQLQLKKEDLSENIQRKKNWKQENYLAKLRIKKERKKSIRNKKMMLKQRKARKKCNRKK